MPLINPRVSVILPPRNRDMPKAKRILRYTAVFEEAPEGGYIVRIPTLGCVTEGDTFEEARKMAADAIRCCVASLAKHGDPIPEEGPAEIISQISVPAPAATR
jgi:antitoxin HicB